MGVREIMKPFVMQFRLSFALFKTLKHKVGLLCTFSSYFTGNTFLLLYEFQELGVI